MMYLIAIALGGVLGWQTAKKRGGNHLDQMQYAAVFSIIGVILALVVVAIAGFAGLI